MSTSEASSPGKAAQKLVELDPLYEGGHRSLMRIYDKLGRHSAALQQFQLCKDIISRELDSEPNEDTIRLYEAIRASTPAYNAIGARCPGEATGAPLLGMPMSGTVMSAFSYKRTSANVLKRVLTIGHIFVAHNG